MKARKLSVFVVIAMTIALPVQSAFAQPDGVVYHPTHLSQMVDCNQVDNALSKIPHGNGDGVITPDEIGTGGWRYNRQGQSFVTFAFTLNGAGTAYNVVAGRSNVGANTGIVNDYPKALDLPQGVDPQLLTFSGHHAVLTLNQAPGFSYPGGDTDVSLHSNGDGSYEGCASSPLLSNSGVLVQEGGDFIQKEYFKVVAKTDGAGLVTYFEFTEVSTFKQVKQ